MRIYDITVPISAEFTPTYPGDPGIEIKQWAALGAGDAANVTLLNFGAHTATHVDAPAHFIEGARRVDALPLDVLIGRARVLEIKENVRVIDEEELARHDIGGVTRLLFKTRNSAFWADGKSNFREDFTYIEACAARALVQSGIRLVGMDYLSVEKFKSERFETHMELLSQNIVIVEGLDLRNVPAGDYELICLPLKVTSGTGDGAPARAVLRTLDWVMQQEEFKELRRRMSALSIPELIEELRSSDLKTRFLAEMSLRDAANTWLSFRPAASQAEREKGIEEWRAWWRAHEGRFKKRWQSRRTEHTKAETTQHPTPERAP